jgi:hypothetical protein
MKTSTENNEDRRYSVNRNKAVQLIMAGLVATTVMTILTYVLPVLGIPTWDPAGTYGAIFNAQVHPDSTSSRWWLGLIFHLLTGTLMFSFLYDFLADRLVLPNTRWKKGIIYAVGLWLFIEVIVKPIAGNGFFSSNMASPLAQTISSLVTWLVYGLLLDTMTRVPLVHELRMDEQKAA